MRVAYIINQYPKVSHTFIRREIQALERRGVIVDRFALRGWDEELVDPEDELERSRTHYALRAGPGPLLAASVKLVLTNPRRFARALMLACRMGRAAERPLYVHLIYLAEACWFAQHLSGTDVQHVHAHFGTNSAEVAMLAHELGAPHWSFTVHGPEEFDKAPQIGLAEKARRSKFVVAVSSYGRSQLYRLLDPIDWPKVQVVHCGLGADFMDQSAKPPPSGRRLVCVGRLCSQKGQALLIEAVAELAARSVDFELVLAGDGEMRGTIEASIARHGIGARIRLTGWISGDEVREEILAARALVLPSFAEGLPVVIMEAMALRRPVISTYVAGIPELVRPGENGWLVPAGDVDALAAAMGECLAAPVATLVRMGDAARAQVLKSHDVSAEVRNLERMFRNSRGQNNE